MESFKLCVRDAEQRSRGVVAGLHGLHGLLALRLQRDVHHTPARAKYLHWTE